MQTKFKLIFETDKSALDLVLFKQSLPKNFVVTDEASGIFISLNSSQLEDHKCQYLIDRELDRHFFLTCVKVKASMVRKQVWAQHTTKYRILDGLDDNIGPQQWDYDLSIQLKLWSLAIDCEEVMLQIILFYQIIELEYPERECFPKYGDPSIPPEPLTECRLLRNLATHSGAVSDRSFQLKKYCEYLNIPEMMHDPTDYQYMAIFNNKVNLLMSEAKRIIERKITITPCLKK